MAIRVFLADDHAVVRDGLRMVLEARGEITVIGEAGNGRDAVRQVNRLQPDVVVMDITMPGLNGIEATAQLQETCPGVQVIILSMHATDEYVFRALQAGASGYVLKESAGKELTEAVRAVHHGQRYICQRINSSMFDGNPGKRSITAMKSPLERLSPREREVLQLVVEGCSSAKIADMIHLSPKTVETYRCRLMKKLGVNDLPALVRFAVQHGVTPIA